MTDELSDTCCAERTVLVENICTLNATQGVCRAYCDNNVQCAGYLYNEVGCYSCDATSKWGDACIKSAYPKGCTPSGQCVLCNKGNNDVLQLMTKGKFTNLTVYASNECTYYRQGGVVEFDLNITMSANGHVAFVGNNARVRGEMRLFAPSVDVADYQANRTVVSTDKLRMRNVRSTSSNGAVVIKDSQKFDGVLEAVTAAPSNQFPIGVINVNGKLQVSKCDTTTHVAVQDALEGLPLIVMASAPCATFNVSAYVAVYGTAYQFAFEDGGLFDTSNNDAIMIGWLLLIFTILVGGLPLLHENVAALVALAFTRRHHPHTE